MKSRNILMLHASSDLYGAGKIFLITILFLKGKNFNIHVALSHDGPLAVQIRKLNIPVHILSLGVIRRKYFSVSGIFNRLGAIRKSSAKLKSLIHQQGINLIYSNTTAVVVGAVVARELKLKHIWHVHEIITKPLFLARFIGFILNHYADRIVAVSEAVKEHWSKYVSKSKIETIYNGIDYELFLICNSQLKQELGLNADKLLIGMMGRVHFWKGQKYFLQLANIIRNRYPHVRFVMVGDAFPGYEYLYEELKELKKSKNLENVVFDLGFRSDNVNILCGLDIFILPSTLPDPFPTVILEAMASAKPVVATNHGGAKEMIVNNQSGILIPWDNPEKSVELISSLVEDHQLRSEMGQKARTRVLKEFSRQAYEDKIYQLISQL